MPSRVAVAGIYSGLVACIRPYAPGGPPYPVLAQGDAGVLPMLI